MKKTLRKIAAGILAATMVLSFTACGSEKAAKNDNEYVIGICNYVDDASLNQICDNIQSRLNEIGAEKGVTFTVKYDNCNADANVLSQIVANFIADKVDLMIGVATPVAMTMQGATEDNKIPVVFSAVSDPLSTGLVASMDAPGANITGTSDMLNTNSIVNMIIANNPEIKKVGLLYDAGQDASTSAIKEAKELLSSKGIEIIEQTGTNVEEVTLAANALVTEGVEAVFTPTDNTIMTAELSIYEIFAEAGIPHYCGADSFALNGAFLGFGVNYADLGKVTAEMAADILINNLNPGEVAVKTFDNGIVTINEDIMAQFGMDIDTLTTLFEAYASKIQTIKTAESFN
ncbi:MAG: ABC transporter substrate-binding protein [Lachnospiraceae bacterium]|nr:ABC transporter substrate-binding protein [Lachnospiraceae bacterium]